MRTGGQTGEKNIRFQTKTDKCGRDFSSWALSIQPKILEISFGTPNGTDHFGLVRSDYSGPALMHVDHCDRSSHFGPSVGPKCSFPSDKIVVHSASLFYPAYKNNNQTRSGLVGSVQRPNQCTVPLGTWKFRNFKPEFLLNGKRPMSPCYVQARRMLLFQQNSLIVCFQTSSAEKCHEGIHESEKSLS